MYSIYCDGVCIHHGPSPSGEYKVLDPKLQMSDNAAGSLTFKMPPGNAGYDILERLKSEIVVKRDNVEIWSGRVIEEETDFWNNRRVTCEGELGYLNDTSQPPAEYHDITPRNFLQTLIDIHNEKVSSSKRFQIGAVTVTDPNDSLYRYTNFESTYEAIKEKLLDRLGGHLIVRKENGVRYLDYLADYPNMNQQTIEFGKNLVDFTKNYKATDVVTVIVPLGCNIQELGEESSISALEEYLTVEEVNDGSIYVINQDGVNEYGWIESVVHWNEVKTPSILLSKAQNYIQEARFENVSLEISAVDMQYMGVTPEGIKLLDQIRCISRPHGMDMTLPVVNVDIPLDKPEDTKYTLGTDVKPSGISASLVSSNEKIKSAIEQMPSTTSILNEAKENADSIINQKTNGFITIDTFEDSSGIHSESLYISDNKDLDYSKLHGRYWQWNVNGLGYYDKRSSSSDTGLKLALTMDGTIVADRILTGQLGLKSWGNYWNMETGEFVLSATNGKVYGKGYKNVYISFNSASTSENNYDYVDVIWRNKNGSYSYVRRMGTSSWSYVYIDEVYDTNIYFYWRSDTSAHNYYGFQVSNIYSYSSGYSYTIPTGTRTTIAPSGENVKQAYNIKSSSYSSIKTDNFTSSYAAGYEDNERKLWNVEINNITSTSLLYTFDNYTTSREEATASEADALLNQEVIFNRLTNGGKTQGIYLSGGYLYINASYIQTGTLSANYISGGIISGNSGTGMTINLNTGAITTKSLTVQANNFQLDSYGNLTASNASLTGASIEGTIATSNGTSKTELSGGSLYFYYGSSYVGSLYANYHRNRGDITIDANYQLYLNAPHVYINGFEAASFDDCYVRASNGRVMHIVFQNGFFTSYDLSGRDAISGTFWVKNSNGEAASLTFDQGVLYDYYNF